MKKLNVILSVVMFTTLLVSCNNPNHRKGNQGTAEEETEESTEVFDGDITGSYSYEKDGEIAYKIEKGYVDNEGFQTYICTTYIKGKPLKGTEDYELYDTFNVFKNSRDKYLTYAKRDFGNNFDKWIEKGLTVGRKTHLIWVKKGTRIQIDRSIWRKNGFDLEDVDFKAKTGVVLLDSQYQWHNMYKLKN